MPLLRLKPLFALMKKSIKKDDQDQPFLAFFLGSESNSNQARDRKVPRAQWKGQVRSASSMPSTQESPQSSSTVPSVDESSIRFDFDPDLPGTSLPESQKAEAKEKAFDGMTLSMGPNATQFQR